MVDERVAVDRHLPVVCSPQPQTAFMLRLSYGPIDSGNIRVVLPEMPSTNMIEDKGDGNLYEERVNVRDPTLEAS